MNNIEKSMYHLKSLYESLNSKLPFDIDMEIENLTELSYKQNSIENLVNIINLERKTIDISNYNFIEEYEIITYGKYSSDGFYFENEEEYNQFIEDNGECISWDDLGIEYDEIYWNKVFNFGLDVDVIAAKKVGLGVLTINSTNESFLFFRGCGMDMSHIVIEYLALAYGAITPNYLDKISYSQDILSKDAFNSLLELLGVDVSKLNIGK
ncbi:MAG: hypothetical protein IJH34_15700 [Romboutsia sp.]|nr:hypothetical protein [Romboutsia sp.]